MDDIPLEQRYYPTAIAYRADQTPNRVFAVLPKGGALEDGFFNLTYRTLDKAIDKAAYWLDEHSSRLEQINGHANGETNGVTNNHSKASSTTFCYVGPNDFRYVLFLAASLKTDRTLMLPMPANTTEGRIKLLKAQGCQFVLTAATHAAEWFDVASQVPGGQLMKVPEISYFLEQIDQPRYFSKRSYAEGRKKPFNVIQSSGTTGDPKPISVPYQFREYFAIEIELNKTSPPDQQLAYAALIEGAYMPTLMPLSWGYATMATAAWPLTNGNVPIMPPSTAPHPMTAEYVFSLMKHMPRGKRNAIVFVPSVLQEFVKDVKKLERLSDYDWIGFVGAPLDTNTGDLVSKYSRVQSILGSTESGGYPLLLNDPQDWNQHRLHPTLNGFFLEPFDGDLYEICLRRQPEESRHCFISHPDPDLQVFHTKDLVRLVPGREKERFWTPAGRVDDFVKLSSMTKFNGVNIEHIISQSPHVKTCLVAGDGREKPFAIVEPVRYEEGVMELIWPAVEEANRSLLEEARVKKEMMILTSPERPMRRLGKGTVDRRNTLREYEVEVEALYAS